MDRMMTRHPLSALWGDLAPSDLASMRESIQEYGFTDPVIWTYGGAVLDGWHRYTIANLLGLELDVREYDGDPVQFVIGKNLHRRHLTAVAALFLRECLHKLGEGSASSSALCTLSGTMAASSHRYPHSPRVSVIPHHRPTQGKMSQSHFSLSPNARRWPT